ncbi:MAG: hypothetical protein O2923_10990 [Verrucomicrobia bacterium]|nr:hypothetical protein [Verrucomicrobiota bacterium]MDA1088158.1 hypothetical protein [Verrucomicrobiota bacterium]
MNFLRYLLTIAICLALTPVCDAVETLRPDELKSGMKGYGLSVFKGTRPERFEVEILGVMKNTFPGQDMILIRLSGANLELHKVIAGMSGSPIYIEDKLIGALAYGWTFENVPMAGVTPIHNMLLEMHRAADPLRPPGISRQGRSPELPRSRPGRAPRSTDGAVTPQRLLTPLSLGGFSPHIVEQLAAELKPFGLLPMSAGMAVSGSDGDAASAPAELVPGGAIGVQLMRGDLSATAVGTITHIDGDRVLAFGHPFFSGGAVRAPAVVAEVHAVMSSLARSFKLASGGAEIGAMIGDWQSCIVADTTLRAHMIPLALAVANESTEHLHRYEMEVMDNQMFTPYLLASATAQAIASATGSSEDTTVRVSMSITLADRTLKRRNTFFNPGGGVYSYQTLEPLFMIFNSPFGPPGVKGVEIDIRAELGRHTAELRRATFGRTSVRRGTRVPLLVELKPYGGPLVTQRVEIDVPAHARSLKQLQVVVAAGEMAPVDAAQPETHADFLNIVERQHASTDLVVMLRTLRNGLQVKGQLLRQLPPSAMNVLMDSAPGGARQFGRSSRGGVENIEQIVVPTEWVLTGQVVATIAIED